MSGVTQERQRRALRCLQELPRAIRLRFYLCDTQTERTSAAPAGQPAFTVRGSAASPQPRGKGQPDGLFNSYLQGTRAAGTRPKAARSTPSPQPCRAPQQAPLPCMAPQCHRAAWKPSHGHRLAPQQPVPPCSFLTSRGGIQKQVCGSGVCSGPRGCSLCANTPQSQCSPYIKAARSCSSPELCARRHVGSVLAFGRGLQPLVCVHKYPHRAGNTHRALLSRWLRSVYSGKGRPGEFRRLQAATRLGTAAGSPGRGREQRLSPAWSCPATLG